MGKLVLHMPDGSLHDIVLAKERLTIGRRNDNDVCLPYPAVSGEHAAVVTILNDSFLEDLGSTNGTLVNGQRVLKHLLRNNDHIDIGRQRLVYLANNEATIDPLPPDVLLRDLTGLREQVERARNRRTDARPAAASELVVEDDEILADLEQAATGTVAEPVRMSPRGPARAATAGAAPRARAQAQPAQAQASQPAQAQAMPPARPAASQRAVERAPVLFDSPEVVASAAPRMPAERTRAGMERVRALDAALAPASPVDGGSRVQPTLWLRVLSGPSEGREAPLAGSEFVLGRVGTQVVRLFCRDGAWLLAPVEGTDALMLNGAPVSREGTFVAPGDRFIVAGAEIEIERR